MEVRSYSLLDITAIHARRLTYQAKHAIHFPYSCNPLLHIVLTEAITFFTQIQRHSTMARPSCRLCGAGPLPCKICPVLMLVLFETNDIGLCLSKGTKSASCPRCQETGRCQVYLCRLCLLDDVNLNCRRLANIDTATCTIRTYLS